MKPGAVVLFKENPLLPGYKPLSESNGLDRTEQ